MPDINILINAKDNGATTNINKVGGAVDNLGDKATNAAKGGLSNLTSALGTALKVGAAAGGLAIAGLAAAVVTTGVNFDNMKQQAQIAFTTMLGDGGKAKAFLDDLQQFAANTPFEFPDLLKASQRLLAMGFAAEDIKPTLTAVGDAVAGLGGGAAEVDRVTTALGQINAKGKASAEEMMQLTEAGIPAWQMLADAIGTDVAGAMDQVSKGAIKSDVVIKAVVNGMNTRFGGMMAKQSKTFGGLLSTIKDTFTQVSGTVMQPLFELMTQGLDKVVQFVSTPEFTAGVQRFSEWLGRVAQQTIDWAIGAWPKVQSAISSVYEIFRLFATRDFRGGIFGLMEDDPFINALFVARDVATSVYEIFRTLITGDFRGGIFGLMEDDPIINALFMIREGFIAVRDFVINELPNWRTRWKEWAAAAWEWTVEAGGLVVAKLSEWAGVLWEWVAANAPIWGEKLIAFAANAWAWLTTSVIPATSTKLAEWATSLYQWVIDAAPAWGAALGEFAARAWDWLTETAIPATATTLGQWWTSLSSWVTAFAPIWGVKLAEFAAKTWEWLTNTVIPNVATRLGEWMTALGQWVVDNAPAWATALAEFAVKAWEWLTGEGGVISQVSEKMGEWFTSISTWIRENSDEWQKVWDTLGGDAIKAMAKGMADEFVRNNTLMALTEFLVKFIAGDTFGAFGALGKMMPKADDGAHAEEPGQRNAPGLFPDTDSGTAWWDAFMESLRRALPTILPGMMPGTIAPQSFSGDITPSAPLAFSSAAQGAGGDTYIINQTIGLNGDAGGAYNGAETGIRQALIERRLNG